MLRLAFVSLLVLLGTYTVTPQSLQFYEEALFFEIKDGYFIVDGQYYFRNSSRSDIHQILFYPFPQEDYLGEIESVSISDVAGFEDDLIINQTEKGVSFRLDIEAGKEKVYKIYYKQLVPNQKAKYILTTTAQWGRPLEKAFYQLKAGSNINVIYFSYPPDKDEKQENYIIYFWYMESFMPDRDLVVEWE